MKPRGRVYSWCGCRDQATGRRLGTRCARRGQRGHGSWYLSLEVPAGADGARRRVRRGGYPTRDVAHRALSQLIRPAPGVADAGPVTVSQWLERWLDLDTGTAVICGQLQEYKGHLTVAPPKTPHSERVIALDRTTVAALRCHRRLQQAEHEQAKDTHHDSGYVFTGLNGDPLAPDRLTRIFKALAAEAGLPPIRLHDLRHGAASLALAAGADLKVCRTCSAIPASC